MAATDQHYRNQKTLNIVFALSCIAMLLSVLWMLVDDYNKPFKTIQREFRDVEESMNLAMMLEALPEKADVDAARQTIAKAREAMDDFINSSAGFGSKKGLEDLSKKLLAVREKADSDYQGIKANFDAESSYRDIDADRVGQAKTDTEKKVAQSKLDKRVADLGKLKEQLDAARKAVDKANDEIEAQINSKLRPKEKNIGDAEAFLKELTGTFDRFAKLAAEKRWKGGDTFRNLPILDGLAAPTRVQQTVLEDLPIDYSFKRVTRYDRCATCHLGIDRATYDHSNLARIGEAGRADALTRKLLYAREILDERVKSGEGKATLGFDVNDLPKNVKAVQLSAGQITQYAVHPRLNLFVDANSPHAMEKFGCTICHGGQPSATDFNYASHTPDNSVQQKRWEGGSKDGHHWHASHYWDFPMLSKRFTESSCLKCHHEVTDLVRYGSKNEAPKLTEGFNLVRENGCFGCHEISGTKDRRAVGPDLRLEPTPALEWLPVKDQLTAKADTLSTPGTLRKVGPSLRRTSEKSSPGFLFSWIKDPRGFRPDTKMPHFYGLSTNSKEALPASQKDFPDAEIASIVYYLQSESDASLAGEDFTRRIVREDLLAKLKGLNTTLDSILKLAEKKQPTPQERLKLSDLRRDQNRLKKDIDGLRRRFRDLSLVARPADYKDINEQGERLQQQIDRTVEAGLKAGELEDLFKQLAADVERLRKTSAPTAVLKAEIKKPDHIIDSKGNPVALAKVPAAGTFPAKDGQKLFTLKGCLACHSHTEAVIESGPKGEEIKEISDAHFGPDLSRIAQKLGPNRESARYWLIQWILNPNVYHPRTRMPITQLTVEEAAGIADWLLFIEPSPYGKIVEPSSATLVAMARLSLSKAPIVGRQFADEVLAKGLPKELRERLAPDADEQLLVDADGKAGGIDDKRLMRYVGKKAISRQGCYACHDIPGFEAAKPIGTALNDWGKKDTERLLFEDAKSFVEGHFNVATLRDDPKDSSKPDASWKAAGASNKPVMEKVFADAVKNHSREGFLQLKLAEPRSYDSGRVRDWDDRLRMPQFKFSRTHRRGTGDNKEDLDEYKKRRTMEGGGTLDADAQFEEAKAREAVMTFVLGLVAEPIPLKYLYTPKTERLAEVKGRHVLEKFNCAGCHEVRGGVYEFKVPESKKATFLGQLESQNYPADHFFPDSTAWVGRPSPVPGVSFVQGVSSTDRAAAQKNKDGDYEVLLTEAYRYSDTKGAVRNLPAGETLGIPAEGLISSSPTYGGTFARLMPPYLNSVDGAFKDNRGAQRAALPPPLIREGEKVQPQWLFNFLREPHLIRPWTVLRMPKFNMSDEDARALVDYFAAVDKMSNPNLGLNEAFPAVKEQDWSYWTARNTNYTSKERRDALLKQIVDAAGRDAEAKAKEKKDAKPEDIARAGKDAREAAEKDMKGREGTQSEELQGVWARLQRDLLARKQLELKAAESDPKDQKAKDLLASVQPQVKALETEVANVEKAIADKKPYDSEDFKKFVATWKTEQVYATDAYNVIVNTRSACMDCHSLGNLLILPESGQPVKEKGPNLALSSERLRPRWTLQWIANPDRLSTVKPAFMPQNFGKDKVPNWHLMVGSQLEQAEAARDLLMNLPKVSTLPVNRLRLAPKKGEYREPRGDQ